MLAAITMAAAVYAVAAALEAYFLFCLCGGERRWNARTWLCVVAGGLLTLWACVCSNSLTPFLLTLALLKWGLAARQRPLAKGTAARLLAEWVLELLCLSIASFLFCKWGPLYPEIPLGSVEGWMPSFLILFACKAQGTFIVRYYRLRRQGQVRGNFQWLFLFASLALLVLLGFLSYQPLTSSGQQILGAAAVLCLLAANFSAIPLLRKEIRRVQGEQAHLYLKKRLADQNKRYAELYQSQQKLRALKHDLHHRLTAIAGMLDAGDVAAAKAYLQSLDGNLREQRLLFSQLPAVDAVIADAAAHIHALGGTFEFRNRLKGRVKIDQMDLAVLIGNALDNALEGLSQVEKRGNVLLQFAQEGDYIHILLENPSPCRDTSALTSTKPDADAHGIGIGQMRYLAAKHQGSVRFAYSPDKSLFRMTALLLNA